MFPVVIGNGRCTTSNSVIGGYQVPKGVGLTHFIFNYSNITIILKSATQAFPKRESSFL